MRIHFVIWSLELGGAQSSLIRLTDELAREHDVSITAVSGSGAEFFQPSASVTYRSLGPNLAGRSKATRALGLLSRWIRLVRLLRAPTDVVVSFMYSTTLVAAPAAALVRRRLVAAERTDLATLPNGTRRIVLAVYRRLCVSVVVQSDELATWMSGRVGAVPVAVIPNPMPELHADAMPRSGVVALGRFAPEKGFEALIEAAGLTTSRRFVAIYGSGPGGHELRSLIERFGVEDRVTLHPPIENPAAVIAGAEALVVPSRVDGFPNVVLEAFALDTPVIATTTTGARTIDGGSGAVRLVSRNARELAGAIDEVCDQKISRRE